MIDTNPVLRTSIIEWSTSLTAAVVLTLLFYSYFSWQYSVNRDGPGFYAPFLSFVIVFAVSAFIFGLFRARLNATSLSWGRAGLYSLVHFAAMYVTLLTYLLVISPMVDDPLINAFEDSSWVGLLVPPILAGVLLAWVVGGTIMKITIRALQYSEPKGAQR